jgi:hypothetical protein
MKLDRLKFFDKILMTIKTAHFKIDKELFGKQDPYIEFNYKGEILRTETMEEGGKDPIFDKEYILEDIEDEWLKEMVFTAKDEDLVGFKFLGSSDPEYRLIDTVNIMYDFDSILKKVALYEEGKLCGHIMISF